MRLPLGLRNRLAELILAALDAPEARRTLEALAAFCRSADGRLDRDAVARLAPLGWFEPAEAERLRIAGAHRPHLESLCRRVDAALAMLRGVPAVPDRGTLDGLLGRAALLANAGLHFEVHELLEPAWMRAEGAERTALQGLIQVAVAFHHAASGNREGAVSLLTEGLAKLAAAGSALPLDIVTWRRALDGLLTAWRGDGVGSPPPSWPSPRHDTGGTRTP